MVFFNFRASFVFQVTEVKKGENGNLSIFHNHGGVVDDVNCLIWAIGRDPNTKIGLENTSISTNAQGHIIVDE